jgi:hypothetical protein
MPKLETENGKAPAKKPAPVKASSKPRPIIYPTRESMMCVGEKVLGEALAKKILKWETEKEFSARMIAGNKDLTEEACAKIFRENDEYGAPAFLLKDEEGNQVRCWNNWGNRPFDDTHMRGLAQTILTRRWADSRNGTDMTDNGETIILTKTARVGSGIHRGVAVIIACQMWRKNPKRWSLWKEAPSIEAVISVGVSDSSRVTETYDNVKPRSIADNLYTSPHFVGLNNNERRECTRMLEKAIDFTWKRVGAMGYKTNQAALEFLNLHPTLEKMVKHLFDENKNRGISLLRLSPGQMAGVAFLMAGSASEESTYNNGNPPSEKLMDLSRLDLAMDFFVMLAAKDKQLKAVHHAIGGMVGDDSEGLGGRVNEKLAVLAKAWAVLAKNPKAVISEHDVALSYWDDEEGVKHLLPGEDGFINCFGGVDLGEKVKKSDVSSPEEIPSEATIEDRKASRVDKAQAVLDAKKGPNDPPLSDAELLERRKKFLLKQPIKATTKPPVPVKPAAPKVTTPAKMTSGGKK